MRKPIDGEVELRIRAVPGDVHERAMKLLYAQGLTMRQWVLNELDHLLKQGECSICYFPVKAHYDEDGFRKPCSVADRQQHNEEPTR